MTRLVRIDQIAVPQRQEHLFSAGGVRFMRDK